MGNFVKDMPIARFISLVDPPATLHYDGNGEALVKLSGDRANVEVAGYSKASFLIGQTKASATQAVVGALSGRTLAEAFTFPNDSKIKTLDVVGPEFGLQLVEGPPNTDDEVQIWVFFQS